jgi:CBS domain-containing protein/nitrogen regulatory protein PII
MSNNANHELLVIILDDIERLPQLLEALRDAGVPGATLFDSIGGYRASSWLDEIGLSGLTKMFGASELKRKTVLSIVEKDHIDGVIAAAEQAVGGFGRPDSGILFTVPVSRTVGLHKRARAEESETVPAPSDSMIAIRDMPVSDAARLLKIEPAIVNAGGTLMDAVRALRESPSAHVAAVVSRTGHLLGLVTLRNLADHLFFGIMPEVFYGEVSSDLDRSLDFGEMANVHNISDIMIDPIAVHSSDTVGQAFRLMHKNDLTGLPIVDDNSHVVGFVGLVELLDLILTYINKS